MDDVSPSRPAADGGSHPARAPRRAPERAPAGPGPARPRTRGPAAVAALGLAGALAAACGGSGHAGGDAAGLTYASAGLVNCLDPQASASRLISIIDRNLFDSLVATGPDGKIQPWLATKWEVSPDGKTYTFHLRSGVTFHDGTPLDAAAVKATMDHAVDPKTKSVYASSLLGPYTGTKVVDASTVRIDLAKPYTPLLQSLSTPYLGIQSPKALRASCTKPVGSGPFSFVSWTQNTSIVLKRNPSYAWQSPTAKHTGPAKLAQLTFRLVPEDGARYGALTSGQADLIDDVPTANVKALKSASGLRFLQKDIPGTVENITFNPSRPPLNDVKVRQALQRSVNVDQLVKSVFNGVYARAWSVLSPASPGYTASLQNSIPYDPAAAAKLLDEAGWTGRDAAGYRTKNGKRLSVRWPVGAQLIRPSENILAQGVQAEAKKAGIEIQYVSEDSGAFVRDVISGNLDLYINNWRALNPDILRNMYASDRVPAVGGSNMFHIKDAQLDGWLNGAAATEDAAARQKAYADVQTRIVQQGLSLPLFVPSELLGVSDKVQNLNFDASLYLQFYDVSLGKA
ncbi:ABC transporter substrate-binding protein [Actinomadura rayongensis]|uniref:ABC transporter substrate-binding protein n=1 Tax=Actinomadura rayongensis TaxID=1429076 RepID=A0A6I4WKR5_9ACTN|nr:ABC transporter substrate-binding protein [Actinomadura rayongensis]MXQ67192.1 ABC transporter substrate-binding protein [Actinomadura rayongensis]